MASPSSAETALNSSPPRSPSTLTAGIPSTSPQPRLPKPPSFRPGSQSKVQLNMTTSSSPLGNINTARRSGMQDSASSARGSQLPQDVQARMKAFHLSRQGPPPLQSGGNIVAGERSVSSSQVPLSTKSTINDATTSRGNPPNTASAGGALTTGTSAPKPPSSQRPLPGNFNSTPAVPSMSLNPKKGLAAKRGLNMGMKLSDAAGPPPAAQEKDFDTQTNPQASSTTANGNVSSLFTKYAEYVDTKAGTLNFKGKATIHGQGIEFSSGSSFSISLDEVDTLDELGKVNYGSVYKVRHSRPKIRKPGQGLSSNRAPATLGASETALAETNTDTSPTVALVGGTTGIVMAMKEIRLELDEAKFAAIIMELDILHRCISPFIVDFYGAFFQEGAVYICMEFMDGGSIDKLYGNGVPEQVLRKITLATVMGLRSLKDEHNIIHRDVKPTNILINTKGHVKICDFGVSGNLVASIAKTNIGCQSYMAPERISGGGVAQAGANPGGGTYSVQSDIWSLGLTIIECGMGQYPYPPETYDNIFSQLSAIVDGEPPDLPADHFSEAARDFVRGALNKIPKLRPTYAMLLRHPWLSPLLKPPTITEEDEESTGEIAAQDSTVQCVVDKEVSQWVFGAMERKRHKVDAKQHKAPALHAAPLSPA